MAPDGKVHHVPRETTQEQLKAMGQAYQNQGAKQAGPKEGDEQKSKSGKPIVFRNGQWVYK